jgi:tight adherence protein C
MPEYIGLRIVGALFCALFVSTIVRKIVKPAPHLASRLRPYTATSRSMLGRNPDSGLLSTRDAIAAPHSVIQRLYRPIAESGAAAIAKLFGSTFDDEALGLRLKQAGVMTDIPEARRPHEYRVRQVGAAIGYSGGGVAAGLAVGLPAAVVLLLALAGGVIGASRRAGAIGKHIEKRRERMKVELYTINQLMAIYLRTSGSPVLAAQRLVKRGRGEVINELDEALRLHTRGMSASRAFGRLAEQTPEPFAARTYKLLASGSERGADLAAGLLSLSEDIRDERRTSVKRTATKRQAAMLVPILACLAPVMLLFIASPLPSLVFDNIR